VNRTDRLYALVEELRAVAPRPRSARWLAERFEVSTRTIERDVSALQQGGVPIWAEPGRTGGYCLDAAHTLPPLGLTVDEALAMTVGLGMLATSPFREAALSALRKVAAVTDEGTLTESANLASRVHLLEGADADATAVTAPLAEALRTGGVLRLRYVDREGAATAREVEPLGCIGKDGDWYLIAWCRLREGVRAFRGDRVLELTPTGERAPRRPLRVDELGIVHGRLRTLDPRESASVRVQTSS
jgi:predicted DNA-binding transcriptional regulator YafY